MVMKRKEESCQREISADKSEALDGPCTLPTTSSGRGPDAKETRLLVSVARAEKASAGGHHVFSSAPYLPVCLRQARSRYGPSLRASRAGCVPAPCRPCMQLDRSTWLAWLDSVLCVLSSQCSLLCVPPLWFAGAPAPPSLGYWPLGRGAFFSGLGPCWGLLGPFGPFWPFLARRSDEGADTKEACPTTHRPSATIRL